MELPLEAIRRVNQVCFEPGVPNSGVQVSDTYVHTECANAPGGNQKSEIVYDATANKLGCGRCGVFLDKLATAYVTDAAENLQNSPKGELNEYTETG